MSQRTALIVVAAMLGACAHGRIAGTEIPNTEANREIYSVVKQAVDAFGKRDSERLLSLVSPRYFEDNGTTSPDDDFGYEQLKQILPQSLEAAKEVFIEVEIHEIAVDGDRAHADLRYRSRARLQLPSGTKWDSHRDFNRLELAREDGSWRITGGL